VTIRVPMTRHTKNGRLPDFLIIGAMRAGTSGLAAYLRSHPQVYMSRRKELHFFDERFQAGVEWYRKQFVDVAPDQLSGEATPIYMYLPEVAPRMHQTVPSAKLVAVLRNPVDRAYSHYWKTRGMGNETLDFEEAIEAEQERLAAGGRVARVSYSYLDRGSYLAQLQNVARYYPEDAIHVLKFEDLRDVTQTTLRSLAAFLGIEGGGFVLPSKTHRNQSISFRFPSLHRAVRPLPRTVKAIERRLNSRPMRYPPIGDKTRARLLEHFAPHNLALERWLGQDFSAWSV